MSAEVLQLSSWVNGPHFLTNSSFPFVPNRTSLITSNLASTKQSLWKTLFLSLHLLKNRQLPFRRHSHLICLVLNKSTCALPHTFSGFCRNMPATVTPMVALPTLLSLTKPSVIYSIWCKESLLKPKEKIFLTIISLNGVAKLLHIHRLLVQMG